MSSASGPVCVLSLGSRADQFLRSLGDPELKNRSSCCFWCPFLQGEELDEKPADSVDDLRNEVGDFAVQWEPCLGDWPAGQAFRAGRDFLILLSIPVTQVLQFNTNCPECNAPANTNMKLVRIL